MEHLLLGFDTPFPGADRFSEEEFSSFLAAVAEGIIVRDAAHQLVYVNDAAAKAMGFISASEVSAMSLPEIWRRIKPLGTDGTAFPLERLPSSLVLSGKEAPSATIRFVNSETGTEDWCHVRSRPVLDEHGCTKYAVDLFTDVTETVDRLRLRDLQNTQAHDALKARSEQQQAVAELGMLSLETSDVQDLFDRAVRIVAETLNVEMCKVIEVLPESDEVLLRAGVGWQEGLVGTVIGGTGESQAGYAFRSAAPVIVQDLRTESRFTRPALLTQHGVVSGVSCLIGGPEGKPWGVLGAYTRQKRPFSPDDIVFIQSMAHILGNEVQQFAAEQALRESEAKAQQRADELAAVLDAVPAIVFLAHDTAGTLITGSRLAHDFLRIPPGENLSKSTPDSNADSIFSIFKDGVEVPPDQLPVQRAARGEFVEAEELEHRFSDGEVRYIFGNARPFFDDQGHPRGAVAAFIDITERRKAEEALVQSERLAREQSIQLAAVMDTVPAAIFVAHDLDGMLITSNTAAHELLRVPEGENFSESVPGNDATSHYKAFKDGAQITLSQSPIRRAAHGETVMDEEYEFHFDNGEVIHVLGSAVPLLDQDGNRTGAISAFIDITGRKGVEAALREANQSLEQRVTERTAELTAVNESLRMLASELSETEQRERQRLAALLHDHLQQMLVAVKMHIAGLGRVVKGQQESTLVSQADDLIGEAIEVSRTLTAELRPPALYESGMIAAINWLAERMEKTHGLKVHIDADKSAEPPVDKGGSLLFESVRELLLNTVKYAGVSECSVRLEHAPGGRVSVTVSDGGAGFDPSAVSDSGFTGSFGLFSIRERLRVLGGAMEIESSPGDGATIRLLAPLSRPEPEAASAEHVRRAESDGIAGQLTERPSLTDRITVLLADDHDIVRRGVAALLRSAGDIEVIAEVGDGIEAVEAAGRLRPDVALLDVNMPNMNGIEAARQIRKTTPGIQILGLSVHADQATQQAMLDAGASAYLPKDSPPENLIAAVREVSTSKRR